MTPADLSILEKIFTIGPGLLCGIALLLGASKKWCWYYQLEQAQQATVAAKQESELRRKEDIERLLELVKAAEERAALWQRLVLDWERTTKATVDVAKKIASTSGS